jgi:hypothetical protein
MAFSWTVFRASDQVFGIRGFLDCYTHLPQYSAVARS